MDTTIVNGCECGTCPGAGCPCGCGGAHVTFVAACPCGDTCACGDSCTCPDA